MSFYQNNLQTESKRSEYNLSKSSIVQRPKPRLIKPLKIPIVKTINEPSQDTAKTLQIMKSGLQIKYDNENLSVKGF